MANLVANLVANLEANLVTNLVANLEANLVTNLLYFILLYFVLQVIKFWNAISVSNFNIFGNYLWIYLALHYIFDLIDI